MWARCQCAAHEPSTLLNAITRVRPAAPLPCLAILACRRSPDRSLNVKQVSPLGCVLHPAPARRPHSTAHAQSVSNPPALGSKAKLQRDTQPPRDRDALPALAAVVWWHPPSFSRAGRRRVPYPVKQRPLGGQELRVIVPSDAYFARRVRYCHPAWFGLDRRARRCAGRGWSEYNAGSD
ncbi:hypothetical protein K466DRAFT_175519 [Polyporus arcularius HHB13444]|uniref:Uncharacterized protein n=1 Tax=Polyporus arcularius HHB13444 TaxID=1314778 RepID=A0A5C3PTH6_9APHY|nr:hypothetical protein K466DRAFT_175519 [Polyporus arcularius HHB13444]